MRTIKRTPPEINTGLNNYSKYFNQMQFNGINQDQNPYTVDQLSFRDADNMYIDSDDRLVSRPTLQHAELPSKIKTFLETSQYFDLGYILYDLVTIGVGTVYVLQATKNNNMFTICFIPKDNITINKDTLSNITKYHISIIDHYLICFNDKGAKLIDSNNINAGWRDLVIDGYVDIPVTKRVTGNTITNLDGNELTKAHKEEYIWTLDSQTDLPDGDASVQVKSQVDIEDWKLASANIGTEYRIWLKINRTLKAINTNNNYDPKRILENRRMSVANGRICIGEEDSFLFSANGGASFTRVYYPTYPGKFLNICSISEDGLNYFFVASDGVYRCDLGSLQWGNKIKLYDTNRNIKDESQGFAVCYHFKTSDIFTFTTYQNSKVTIYWKAPGLYMGDDYTKDSMGNIDVTGNTWEPYIGWTELENSSFDYTTLNIDNDRALNLALMKTDNNEYITFVVLAAIDTTGTVVLSTIYGSYEQSMKQGTYRIGVIADDPNLYNRIALNKVTADNNEFICDFFLRKVEEIVDETGDNFHPVYYVATSIFTLGGGPSSVILVKSFDMDDLYPNKGGTSQWPIGVGYMPYETSDCYIVGDRLYYKDTGEVVKINNYDNFNFGADNFHYIYRILKDNDSFYWLTTDSKVFTNTLIDNGIAVFTYTYENTEVYTNVPDVSYADTNLYLGFGDLLQITKNTKDPTDLTKTLFNLPGINNQSFIDDITGMINISTTEVALFFKDKIVICAKVEDSNQASGYRYDYYNTKLSTGIRLGDIVMNSLEGSFTIFPTRRGLAAMNYQAFMATTDQVISYISDTVSDLWEDFYNASDKIHIIQWRKKLVLTNGTGTILLYYLETNTWWRWTVPVDVFKSLSDQTSLQLIKDTLLIFEDTIIVNNKTKALRYYDFSKDSAGTSIKWSLVSQPLHMSAPNYYKNIRQLIFQFFDTADKEVTKTFLAHVKLYRKRVTIREPETVSFKVDELRTFVKRFNYWKINELQWGLTNDENTATPDKFELNGITIKYELGEEVR